MRTIKGPAIFLAQFLSSEADADDVAILAQWTKELGYRGVQLPTGNPAVIDLKLAAESLAYCDDLRGRYAEWGLEITELSTHFQGQLVAVHPAYDALFDGFAPEALRGNPAARQAWAIDQLKLAARASANLGLSSHATFSGALLWPYLYPWPQRPAGLVDTAFDELARRWRPILDDFDHAGVDVCYELHPGEDLHDGVTFERFLDAVGQHPRCHILYDPSHMLLQQMDYLGFIDIYHSRIRAFHVKDAEFVRSARQGIYGGFENWLSRAGRFRSVGDGQVDFSGIFSRLTQYGYAGWAVLEWECCIKAAAQGAAEGAPFIANHIIQASDKAFDDFASVRADQAMLNQLLGIAN